MGTWALIPIKARGLCKTRLSPALDERQRVELARGMLTHVLATLGQVAELTGTVVLSDERDCVPLTIEVMSERGEDLNSSLAWAMNALRQRGARTLLVLPGDLPLLVPDDVRELLSAANDSGFAIAPDDREAGTNGLCVAADLELAPAFGIDSFRAHLRQAARLGVCPGVVRTQGLGFDVDEPIDYQIFSGTGLATSNLMRANY